MVQHRIYAMSVARVYPLYVAKAEKKERTRAEVDQIMCWLTGYTPRQLEAHLSAQTNFEDFFAAASQLNLFSGDTILISRARPWTRQPPWS